MRLLKLLVAIALCLSLSVVAFAHPGRTDPSGGHIDHSTGEYHYHHGYTAHQHSDTDGDGILDCPYRIIGKPNSSSSDIKSSKIEKPKEETDSPKQESKSSNKQKIKLPNEVLAIIIFAVIFGGGGFVVDFLKDKIKRKTKK